MELGWHLLINSAGREDFRELFKWSWGNIDMLLSSAFDSLKYLKYFWVAAKYYLLLRALEILQSSKSYNIDNR